MATQLIVLLSFVIATTVTLDSLAFGAQPPPPPLNGQVSTTPASKNLKTLVSPAGSCAVTSEQLAKDSESPDDVWDVFKEGHPLPRYTPAQVIETADRLAKLKWTPGDENVQPSCLDRAPAGQQFGTYPKGVEVSGIPYLWGARDGGNAFCTKLRAGGRIIAFPLLANKSGHGCAIGIDCAGFVTFCWGLRGYFHSLNVPAIYTQALLTAKGQSSLFELVDLKDIRPGDAIIPKAPNGRLNHIVLFKERKSSAYVYYEARGSGIPVQEGYIQREGIFHVIRYRGLNRGETQTLYPTAPQLAHAVEKARSSTISAAPTSGLPARNSPSKPSTTTLPAESGRPSAMDKKKNSGPRASTEVAEFAINSFSTTPIDQVNFEPLELKVQHHSPQTSNSTSQEITEKTIRIRNLLQNKRILKLAISGSSSFALPKEMESIEIPAGQETVVRILFSPSGPKKTESGTLTLDDGIHTRHTLSLTGSAYSRCLSVLPNSPIAFNNSLFIEHPQTAVVRVQNCGSVPINLQEPRLLGNAGVFRLLSHSQLTLQPNEIVGIPVTFAPSGYGTFEDTLAIESSINRLDLKLIGAHTTPCIKVQNEIALGRIISSHGGESVDIRLDTCGAEDVTGLNVALAPGNKSSSISLSASPSKLTKDSHDFVRVRIAPEIPGSFQVSILVSADRIKAQSVTITGEVVPCLAAAPAELRFGPQPIYSKPALLNLSIKNCGVIPVDLRSIKFADRQKLFGIKDAPASPTLIRNSESRSYTVVFRPRKLGNFKGRVLLDYEGAGPHEILNGGQGVSQSWWRVILGRLSPWNR